MQKKNAKREWVEKVYDYVIACNSLKEIISDMKVIEYFEPRPYKAVTFVVERGKEWQDWNVKSVGRSPGRGAEEKGWEEGEEDEGSEERRVRSETTEEVIRSSQMMALEESCVSARKRIEGQNSIQRWDCSKIET